jgi:glycosyltransferase involved in cell wall biosynthesis/ubiquinone/menaquinone biosynthesis C-methylase UbiE/predicted  nucleic acid-binding Zn-ribbon protein
MLEWTGERYLPFIDPSVCGAEIHYEHLHRYAFASQYVKGKKVLDLASGEGFGTSILSKDAKWVVGIDIDHDAILHASNTYKKENISFIEGSILNIPIGGRKIFDVIVCFEAIEHVRDHDIVIKEITRLLNDDGILIISTPNKKTYSDDADYKNPYHQKELYYSEFYDLLKKNFTYIYLSGQQVFSGSSIFPVSSEEITSFSEFVIELAGNQFSFSGTDENLPRYFIAIASNIRLDPKQIQKSYLIDKSNVEIALLNNQVGECNSSIQSLQQIRSDQDSQLFETNKKIQSFEQLGTIKDDQLQALTSNVSELSKRANNLEIIILDKDNQISELSKRANNLEVIILDKDNQISELSKRANNLETIIVTRDNQVSELIAHTQSLMSENNSIKQSITYQLTQRFHRNILEPLFPFGSQRRKHYDLGLKGGRILLNEGWDSFWYQFNERKSHNKSLKREVIVPRETIIPIQPTRLINTHDLSISVIIPTKNAGHNFEFVLEKIKNQKGVKNIEIVIVDSGSTDTTIEIAKKYHCRVFSIKSEDFNHGLTRNFGAQRASGEYIVFMVQDAIPVGEHWLYWLVKPFLEDAKIAAVTCKQVPRSDADIFACYSMWYHYKTMGFTTDRIVQIKWDNFNDLSFFEKRKLAGLDDVCSCFKKDIFNQFKFEKQNFAEDLNLGTRLLENGYKLAFLASVGVIHSHNRNAEYFFRRYYVDSKSLNEMYTIIPDVKEKDLNQAINSINALYYGLCSSLATLRIKYPNEINVDIFFSELKRTFNSDETEALNVPDNTDLSRLIADLNSCSTSHSEGSQLFINNFIFQINSLYQYTRDCYSTSNTRELSENIFKLFAAYSGSYLGDLYCYHSTDSVMKSIDDILKTGV